MLSAGNGEADRLRGGRTSSKSNTGCGTTHHLGLCICVAPRNSPNLANTVPWSAKYLPWSDCRSKALNKVSGSQQPVPSGDALVSSVLSCIRKPNGGNRHSDFPGDAAPLNEVALPGQVDRMGLKSNSVQFKKNGWKVCQSSQVTKSALASQTLLQLGKCLLAPWWQACWDFAGQDHCLCQ